MSSSPLHGAFHEGCSILATMAPIDHTTTEQVFDLPGQGWSNGDISPQFYPVSHAGKVVLYGSQRRWIGLKSGWTRIGEGTTEHDHVHSSSLAGHDLHECDFSEGQAVRALISQLCERFYQFGWATGTGGGVSIRVGGKNGRPWRVFVAPSGIQKEDMIGDDIYELVRMIPFACLSLCMPLPLFSDPTCLSSINGRIWIAMLSCRPKRPTCDSPPVPLCGMWCIRNVPQPPVSYIRTVCTPKWPPYWTRPKHQTAFALLIWKCSKAWAITLTMTFWRYLSLTTDPVKISWRINYVKR